MILYTWDGCLRESLEVPTGSQATCSVSQSQRHRGGTEGPFSGAVGTVSPGQELQWRSREQGPRMVGRWDDTWCWDDRQTRTDWWWLMSGMPWEGSELLARELELAGEWAGWIGWGGVCRQRKEAEREKQRELPAGLDRGQEMCPGVNRGPLLPWRGPLTGVFFHCVLKETSIPKWVQTSFVPFTTPPFVLQSILSHLLERSLRGQPLETLAWCNLSSIAACLLWTLVLPSAWSAGLTTLLLCWLLNLPSAGILMLGVFRPFPEHHYRWSCLPSLVITAKVSLPWRVAYMHSWSCTHLGVSS